MRATKRIPTLASRGDWEYDANCKGMNPTEHFFRQKERYNQHGQPILDNRGEIVVVDDEPSEEARAACAGCSVKDVCLDWALHHELHGFQGGMTAQERFVRRSALNIIVASPQSLDSPPPPRSALDEGVVHGTNKGYKAHFRQGQYPCAACLRAHSDQHHIAKERKASQKRVLEN
jgi:hypothetical protein